MKVAFFIGSLNRGGAETLLLDIFRRKNDAPFECMLIYRNEGDLSDEFRATGVPMFRLKPRHGAFAYFSDLRHLLKENKVDILHTHTVANGVIGILSTCFSGIKLAASFHGFISMLKYMVFTHLIMWFADRSIFVSNYERDWFLSHVLLAPRNRCEVVYNGIDFSKFDASPVEPDFLKEEASVEDSCLRMTMVGNFVSGRSQLFLCKALKALSDKGSLDFRFYFIGKQSLKEPERWDDCLRYCRDNHLLGDKVVFLGGRADVPSVLQYMDAFVYASECDSFGIAVVEAMAAGVPVIVNDWIVMKEVTQNGEWASIYKTDDIDDCVAKIEDLARTTAEKRNKALALSEVVRHRFSIENHIQNLFLIYKSLLSDDTAED